MSESPSVYIPRQVRPRRTSYTPAEPTAAPCAKVRESAANDNIRSGDTNEKVATAPPVEASGAIRIGNTDSTAQAVTISGSLGSQIYKLSLHRRKADQEPTTAAFLLGYAEDDGSVHLNRLDSGVSVGGQLAPTAIYNTDVVVPLCHGSSKPSFYAWAIKTSCAYRVVSWMQECSADNSSLALEFISTNRDMCISLSPASPIDITNLPFLLTQLRHGAGRGYGVLRRKEWDGSYEAKADTPVSSEHPVWAAVTSQSQKSIGDAYQSTGAPATLRVAQIAPSQDYMSATVKHFVASCADGYARVAVQLASMQIAPAYRWLSSTARFVAPSACGQDVADVIRKISERSGLSLIDPQHAQQIATPLHLPAIRSPALSGSRAPTEKRDTAPIIATRLASHYSSSPGTNVGKACQPNLPEPPDGEAGFAMSEFLAEQRQIRSLLEEQNNLIKTHVAQTQELVRLVNHQPSPQAITRRRYLWMKGVHSPVSNSHGATGNAPSSYKIRRSNSLSEMVDGIKSFEVEGYEETEHHTGFALRRPLSFASPSSAADTHFSAAAASQSASGVTGLVSRISHAVGDSPGSVHAPPTFTRPPLPRRTQPRSYRLDTTGLRSESSQTSQQSTHKVTPTTQKYLDSLAQQRPRHSRSSSHTQATFARRISDISGTSTH
ncbi:hypothetical protein GQ54DRAFT_302368 [Martensiomyces pterosporus]|nr:hypothetical protein GQ54DRAFT_302368 [Martensiomyces pterosporus]